MTVLLAKAESDGKMLRAQGQAKAAAIYSAAYNQNKDFFLFYRYLKTYQRSFTQKNDVLILDEQSPFFNYFRNGMNKDQNLKAKG